MGFFDKISGKTGLNENWNIPETTTSVEKLFEPEAGLHVVYKHSFSCGVSVFAKTRIERVLEELSGKATFHFIDVHANRPVSDYVAEASAVRHESPQLIILYNGDVYGHASHNQVQPDPVQEAVEEIYD